MSGPNELTNLRAVGWINQFIAIYQEAILGHAATIVSAVLPLVSKENAGTFLCLSSRNR